MAAPPGLALCGLVVCSMDCQVLVLMVVVVVFI
jgi:hypothetical protein